MKTRIFTSALLIAISSFAFCGDTAESMLAKIKAMKTPPIDQKRMEDKAYIEEYKKQIFSVNQERGKLIFEFYKAYPENEQTEKLMNQRWAMMLGYDDPIPKPRLEAAIADTKDVVASNPPPKIKQGAKYWQTYFMLSQLGSEPSKASGVIDGFTKEYPADPRGAQLLQRLADMTPGDEAKIEVYNRIAKDYKDSIPGKYAPGIVRRMKGMGQPFDLAFTDAITGKPVSIKDLKGKVVLIDFWATWCGPCVGEMPHMKKLYADLHGKGLEILGVSLDQPEDKGGLKALKDFVAKNEVSWPQYYQGNFWSSEFSTSWGINSIPCVFVIDKNGKLANIMEPEGLDPVIKKLLGN